MRKSIFIYDNGGETVDRYTVLIDNGYCGWDMFSMSDSPLSPDGFNQYNDTLVAFNPLPSWGTRVFLKDLPKAVIKAIRQRNN